MIGEVVHAFVVVCGFLFEFNFFSKTSVRNTIRVSNSLDPGHERRFVGPDLGLKLIVKVFSRQKGAVSNDRESAKLIKNCTLRLYFDNFEDILRENSLAIIYNLVSYRRSLKHSIFLIGRFANMSVV